MSIVRCAVMVVVVWGALAGPAEGCVCADPRPSCEKTFAADAVFVGVVRSLTLATDAPQDRETIVHFDVADAFRGVDGQEFSVRTSGPSLTCGYTFVVGETYVVYASRRPNNTLWVDRCSGTERLADADDDLAFLRTLDDPPPAGARVFGRVSFPEWLLPGAGQAPYPPPDNVRVVLRSAAAVLETRTDADGRYAFTSLPTGRYEISVVPPAGLRDLGIPGTSGASGAITLPDVRACAARNPRIAYDGRISGTVTMAAGSRLPEGTTVELLEQHAPSAALGRASSRVTPDASGRYEFTGVPPGQYFIAVDATRDFEPRVVFPTTYHPGTSTTQTATTVDLAGGERRVLPAFALPEPRARVRFTGVVRMPDGTPVSAAHVSISDGDGSFRTAVSGVVTDADGRFETRLHAGLRYMIQIVVGGSGRQAGPPLRARVGIVMPETEPDTFEIVLSVAPPRGVLRPN